MTVEHAAGRDLEWIYLVCDGRVVVLGVMISTHLRCLPGGGSNVPRSQRDDSRKW